MSTSILILGANGQDGRLLCDYFDSKNIFYDIVVRNSYRHSSKNIREVLIGDLNDYDFIKNIFEKINMKEYLILLMKLSLEIKI